MGMFDNLYVKKKLPLTSELKKLPIKWGEVCWQTKSLDNYLGYYTITSAGKLMEHKTEGEWKPLPIDQQTKWYTGEYVVSKEWKEEVKDFHGIVNFYTFEDVKDKNETVWVEFDAYFIYGKLDKIVLNKTYTEQYDSDRHEKLYKNIQARLNHPWNKIKNILNKFGWSWCWRKVVVVLQKLNKFINIIIFKIQRHLL
jgi:hypothetical protein